MSTIKSYTDIEQSRKLVEILSIESADGGWYGTNDPLAANTKYWLYTKYTEKASLPAWSLAALLGVFPYYEINNNGVNIQLSVKGEALITEKGEYLLDLAVNMIIRLNELNLL